MRLPAIACLLALPAAAQSAFGPVTEAWTAKLAGGRAMLLLVDVNPGWANRMLDPALEDIAFELVFENVASSDPVAQRLGLGGPAAYLLNEAGQVLGSWRSGPPSDVRAAFAEAGWRTRAETLRAALRARPDRLDLRWALVAEYWQRVPRRYALRDLEALAEALEALLRTGAWASAEAPRLPVFAAPKRLGGEAPAFGNSLTELARNRFQDVRETLLKEPGNATAWMLAAQLAAWHPDTEPRLSVLAAELEPAAPPSFEAHLEWPAPQALQLAEMQLRRLEDWKGLEAFAEARVEFLRGAALALAPEWPSQWHARLSPPPPQARVPLPFAAAAARGFGRWLVLLLEAQLRLGRTGAAAATASALVRDGDRASRSSGLALAKGFKAEAVARILEAALD
jgi:hypothetical protein